jgi:membrane-associated phospholipid phosphatase
VNNAIKFAVARARPEAFFGELPSSYSFASGHALYSGCIYGVLGSIIAAEMPKTWQRALVLAGTLVLIAVIGFSRVYLGVHYPTDVLAGFALAALIICVARRFMGESAPA